MILSKFFRQFLFLPCIILLFLTNSSYKLQIDTFVRRFVFYFNSILASMGEFERSCRRQNTKARAISVLFDICEHGRGTELDADTRGKELICHG